MFSDLSHIFVEETSSTMRLAREEITRKHIAGGITDSVSCPAVFVAERQTEGYGRRQRLWLSPRGNLYATLALRPVVGLARLGEYGFLASLAAASGAESLGSARLSCKWPNDVLYEGGKVGGILLESLVTGEEVDVLLIGWGINLHGELPKEELPSGYSVARLSELGVGLEVSPRMLLDSILDSFSLWHETWTREGFSAVREAWELRAHEIGDVLEVDSDTGRLRGMYGGLDARGHLLLDTATGRRVISAGDVWQRDAATDLTAVASVAAGSERV
ncbi:MAG: biotin--[acetyl-CoA-carboxylase] ligase [Alphaproteobacteria bacterium]